MKKIFGFLLVLFLISGVAAGCGTENKIEAAKDAVNQDVTKKTEVTVSAAASLKDAMNEIKEIYEKNKKDINIIYNFGSSGALQRQIEQGSPVDLFISAGKKQMDALQEQNLINKESRIDLLGNDLVLIVGKDNKNIKEFSDLSKPEVKHIGIGNPDSVPAGKYAQEALNSMKLWDKLKNKYVEAKDVRQVLSYVETGNAEAGLVYKSDILASEKVRIAATAPADSHEPIVYPAAIISSTKNINAAVDFLNCLQTDQAKEIFVKYGFKTAEK